MLIPWGEQEIDSALAGVLNGAMPLFVAVLAHQFLAGERLNGPRSVGLALGFAGLVVVIGPDLLDVASESTQGQLAVVAATLGYASGAVLTRRRLLGVDSTLLAGAQSAIAFAMLTPLLLTFESVPRPSDLSSRVLLASVGLALLSSGVALHHLLLAAGDGGGDAGGARHVFNPRRRDLLGLARSLRGNGALSGAGARADRRRRLPRQPLAGSEGARGPGAGWRRTERRRARRGRRRQRVARRTAMEHSARVRPARDRRDT